MNPVQYIQERQHSWALRHGVRLDEHEWAVELNDNLFLPLIPGAIAEFGAGAGGELDGRMRAPHSSSALVVNVFHYWRLFDDVGPILAAIAPGLAVGEILGLRFEVRCPIAWPIPRGIPPHLDVVIRYRDAAEPAATKAVAVESKFAEGYGQGQGAFVASYLAPENAAIWEGMEPLRDLADQIHRGKVLYDELNVAQLVKHVLGLRAEFEETRNFELVYLWYPVFGREAVRRQEEIERFRQVAAACQPPVTFRATTYPDLIQSLAVAHGETHGAYVDYLAERYF